jgi:multiple sugar transport system substrate-binding protein
MLKNTFAAALAILVILFNGCGSPRAFEPIAQDEVLFWDRQNTETGDLLQGIVDDFNETHEGLPVRAVYSGDYGLINQKVQAAIQARRLPSMSVGYESMTSEYIDAGAVVNLEGLIADSEIGFSEEELNDFFPVVIETNRYPQHGNDMYSFPFTKSLLLLYFNQNVLEEAGIEAPPSTWTEFIAQCRQVKERTGKYGHAVAVDASTFDGMVYSMGGDVYDGEQALFDSPETIAALKVFETLAEEDLAYEIQREGYQDREALAQGRVAFIMRSSSSQRYIRQSFDDQEDWGIARIPQADPDNPATVLYGPNINIFKTTAEQERQSWQFVKYFTSPDVSVRWALETGYLPIRKSAAQDPRMQAHWAEWKYNKVPFECLSFARSEPKAQGWQQVRVLIEKAVTSVLAGRQSAEEAAADLDAEADRVLAAERGRSAEAE